MKLRLLIPVALLFALFPSSVNSSIDLPSYCAGWCRGRYEDGVFLNGRCFCGDYYPIHFGRRFEIPKRPKKDFNDPTVYDGKDEIHYAPSE